MDQHDIRRAIARLTPGQALTLARQARAELSFPAPFPRTFSTGAPLRNFLR